ncbi:MAG TPA: hypothetical protein VLJ59_17935 [Mycobacteriales bacterium]|nr:hypothetical protein [Mycobacteriales bacterium]
MTEEARRSSETEGRFPYGGPGRICYIEHRDDGLDECRQVEDLQAALQRARSGETRLYAVWPGQWRSDLYLIDELDSLADAIGLPADEPPPELTPPVRFTDLPHDLQARLVRGLKRSVGRALSAGWHVDPAPDGAELVTVYPYKPGGRGNPVGGGIWRWDSDRTEFDAVELWPKPSSPLGQDPTVRPSPRDPLARRLPSMAPGSERRFRR